MSRCVVVGASLGGMRAAEAVRKAGFTGEVMVVGDEPHMPYNRPPLSKEALLGASTEDLALRIPRAAQDVVWRLGERVVAADLAARTVALADGETVGWSGLVVASGLSARRTALPGPAAGRHVIRTLDDADALRKEFAPGVRLVIVGAGFVGCEVAAAARVAGLEVDVVAPENAPIERVLGIELGSVLRRRHEERGVRFHLGRVPVRYAGTTRVAGVRLSDGTELPADVVLEAVGGAANTDWLEGNGLDLGDGVLCDNLLRVEGRPDVVACGDVARFPNPLFDDVPRRVEHWTMAADTAKRAGATLGRFLAGRPDAGADGRAEPFTPIPSFWSDQYELRLQSFGAPEFGVRDVRMLEGALDAEAAVGYYRAGRLVGVVLTGMPQRYLHYRGLIATSSEAES